MPKLVLWSRLGFFFIVFATSTNILFGSVRFINLLNIRFNYFYNPKVIDIVIFSSLADSYIWAASLLLVVFAVLLIRRLLHLALPRWLAFMYFLLFASFAAFLSSEPTASALVVPFGWIVVGLSIYFANGLFRNKGAETVSFTIIGMIVALIPIELASVSSWISNAFNYEVAFGSSLRWTFPWIDLQLFSVLYPLTVLLFLLLLYSWVWVPALKYVLFRVQGSVDLGMQKIGGLNRRYLALGLALSLVASAFLAYYPYIHLPSSTLVGVDSISYYNWLKTMMQQGPNLAFQSDRPLFLLLLDSIKYATALSPLAVVRIIPAICAVCLSLAVFWLVEEGTDDKRLALISSVFSSFSFQTTVGIFAYYLANWLAISETFIVFVFLLKSQKRHSWTYASISATIGIVTLLTHPYTWDVLITVLLLYLVWLFLSRPRQKSEIALVTVPLATNLLFYMLYTLTSLGGGVGQGEGSLSSAIGIPNLHLQSGLATMVSLKAGGLFENPLMIILAVIGVFSIISLRRSLTKFHKIMLLWVIVPSLALLTITPEQDSLYYRLVYLIPFQILAAVGLYWILSILKDAETKFKTSAHYLRVLRVLLFVIIVLFLLNYALRSVDEAMIYGNLKP